MPTVVPLGKSQTVELKAGERIDARGAGGRLWRLQEPRAFHTPCVIRGPGTFRIDALAADIEYSLAPTLAAQLDRATEVIKSHRIIAAALIKGKQAMAMHDKFKMLADRARDVPKALETRADVLFARLDALEKGGAVFDKMEAFVSDVEKGVSAAEDAMNQLAGGNGGPPLGG